MEMKARSTLPYPKIEVCEQNKRYATLLFNDYAGQKGELTATTKYFYQHLVIQDADIAKFIMDVSIVEMQHLEMLGRLISAFGADPRLYGTKYYWDAGFVSYDRNLISVLNKNIAQEYEAIEGYQKRMNQIDDEGARKVLARIIIDEQEHINAFKSCLERLF